MLPAGTKLTLETCTNMSNTQKLEAAKHTPHKSLQSLHAGFLSPASAECLRFGSAHAVQRAYSLSDFSCRDMLLYRSYIWVTCVTGAHHRATNIMRAAQGNKFAAALATHADRCRCPLLKSSHLLAEAQSKLSCVMQVLQLTLWCLTQPRADAARVPTLCSQQKQQQHCHQRRPF
jgi:hypothetical protein